MSVDMRHPTDVVRISEKAPTIAARDYKGGNSVLAPMPIADKATRYKGGGDTRHDDGSANGFGIGEPGAPANTLTAQDRHGVAYAIQGNMIGRAEKNGPQGSGINEDVSFTLTDADRHAVAYAMQGFGDYKESDKHSSLKQRDYKDATDLVVEGADYIIRRFTPLECCRLQGFPDEWAQDLAIENPTAKTIREWMIVWAEWWRLIGRAEGIQLPKDAAQTERWLKDPESDSALYKMWGNGVALPCVMYVMEGIAEVLKEENEQEANE